MYSSQPANLLFFCCYFCFCRLCIIIIKRERVIVISSDCCGQTGSCRFLRHLKTTAFKLLYELFIIKTNFDDHITILGQSIPRPPCPLEMARAKCFQLGQWISAGIKYVPNGPTKKLYQKFEQSIWWLFKNYSTLMLFIKITCYSVSQWEYHRKSRNTFISMLPN